MVKITKGALIDTEPSIKEVISRLGESEKFVIEDINDNCIFIKREAAINIKDRVSKIMAIVKD
jgi:Transcription factor TFIIH complex subunit Tfb5